jgi:hypothetical protein
MRLEGPIEVSFASPAWRDHHREQNAADRRQQRLAARQQIDQALAAARNERVTHLVSLLGRVRDASLEHEGLSITELLAAFSEDERGQMYAALWRMCPEVKSTQWISVVSGHELLFFDPEQPDQPARRITVPDALGPLRSVSMDARSLEAGLLMVGAATGVLLVDLDSGQVRSHLQSTVAESPAVHGGVNAAAMSEDRVFATHSELGLMSWRRDEPDRPAEYLHPELTHGATTVRGARVAEGWLWFTVDDVLWAVARTGKGESPPVRYSESGSPLSAITTREGTVYAGNTDGQVIAWPVDDPASGRVIRGKAGGPVESLHVVSAAGVEHLVVADRSDALLALVLGDSYACRYESGGHGVRRGAAAPDVFCAMNDRRDRLMIWHPHQAEKPAGTVVIPHLTQCSLQDLALIPASGTTPSPDRSSSPAT